ncbi:HPF/RaiA family ribosome-associated protein [Spirulina sp. CS-785/01]|uniref:HPF/RaiA family ribosome-associated protein n=1 Tax=Spirulina sp. CS-785/01 TaxID=3021716 RepID=UPI00232CF8DF|nr:HPF/RaiA family ribosome-associated protein [Spirulina sp. CS-785/01]MDB9315568.1 HPF/RaiA family ribosome-associated protein [Spirulina sp. CS-785/01]
MQVPLNISYRDVPKTDALDALVQEKVGKLERVCDHISSCHVAIEKTHKHPKRGSPYRVRVDLTVPPGHEIAATENPHEGTQYEPVDTAIRRAFDAARRQLVELNERQHNQVKSHPNQQMAAVVSQLFPDEGYGFLKTFEGQEIYFHRNSVLHNDFARLDLGTGVQFFAEAGEQGLYATTVQIVNKPGESLSQVDEPEIKQPIGWYQ